MKIMDKLGQEIVSEGGKHRKAVGEVMTFLFIYTVMHLSRSIWVLLQMLQLGNTNLASTSCCTLPATDKNALITMNFALGIWRHPGEEHQVKTWVVYTVVVELLSCDSFSCYTVRLLRVYPLFWTHACPDSFQGDHDLSQWSEGQYKHFCGEH